MSGGKVFLNWACALDSHSVQAGTPVYLPVETMGVHPNLVTSVMGSSGQVYKSNASLISGDAMARISTRDIKNFLDNCGNEGMKIDNGVNGDGVIIYFQKAADKGTRASGSVHHKTTIGDGFMAPTTLVLPHQGDALINADIYPESSDGESSPFTFDEAAALPSGVNITLDAMFTLGKVDLNGTDVTGHTDVTINFNLDVRTISGESDLFYDTVYVLTIDPDITLTSYHPDVTSTLTELGLSYDENQVIIYLRKRLKGGSFVPDATAQHIKCTLGECRAEPASIDSEPEKQIGIRLKPWYESAGPTNPMTWDTAAQIA